jgi:hypothetical protein
MVPGLSGTPDVGKQLPEAIGWMFESQPLQRVDDFLIVLNRSVIKLRTR